MSLVHGEWTTEATFSPITDDQTFKLRAFQGRYNVSVMYQGDVICQHEYVLLPGQDPLWEVIVEIC